MNGNLHLEKFKPVRKKMAKKKWPRNRCRFCKYRRARSSDPSPGAPRAIDRPLFLCKTREKASGCGFRGNYRPGIDDSPLRWAMGHPHLDTISVINLDTISNEDRLS